MIITPAVCNAPALTANVTGTKTVSGSFHPNGTVTYTVTLANTGGLGQADNPGHEFTGVLPASLTLVSAVASSGNAVATVATNAVTWDGAIAPVNGTVTITITATVKPAFTGTVSNQGTISYDADGNGTNESTRLTDDPGVGGASDPTSFTSTGAIVTATKTVTGPFLVGDTVTYTVTISNSGNIAAGNNPGNEFTDVLPAGVALVSANATSGTAVATVATNTVTWNGSIPAGGSVTITISATIKPGTGGTTISNQGTLSYDSDGNATNDAAGVTDDPGTAAANDPTSFVAVNPVPALSPCLLLLVAACLAMVALRVMKS